MAKRPYTMQRPAKQNNQKVTTFTLALQKVVETRNYGYAKQEA